MKAIETNTTTKRRALLGLSAATIAAGIGASLPAVAEGAPDAKEAELIRRCNRLVAIRAEENRIYATVPQTTLDEQEAMEERLVPARAEWREIEARIYELDVIPKTPAGISAVARAALAEAERTFEGEIITDKLDGYLAMRAIEAMEPDASAVIEGYVREAGLAAERMAAAKRGNRA